MPLNKIQQQMLEQTVQDRLNKVDEHTEQLAQTATKTEVEAKRDKSVKITNADLDISADANKIKLINLADEVQQALTGNAPALSTIADYAVSNKKIAPSAVSDDKLTIPYVMGVKTKNLFNKDAVTSGYYVKASDGTLAVNASYSASDYIPVTPNTTYFANKKDQVAFYNANLVFISGIDGAFNDQSFTTPSNAAFMRMTVNNGNLGILQIELGSTGTTYEAYGHKNKEKSVQGKHLADETVLMLNLSKEVKKNIGKKAIELLESLNNPFVTTKVKLLGDSITAGLGGTGYSTTGEAIGTTGFNANVSTATNWANSLKKHLETRYNKDFVVMPNNENITYIKKGVANYTLVKIGYAAMNWYVQYEGADYDIQFRFYGDHFSLLNLKDANGGIFDIYVDDVKVTTVDFYSATNQFSQETQVTGLSLGWHTVKIVHAGKNPSASTTGRMKLEGIKIPKRCIAKNWGVSGKNNAWLYDNKETLVESDDDFIIVEMGTNDRGSFKGVDGTKYHLSMFIDYVKSLNKQVVIMSPPPSSVASDTGVNFKLDELDFALRNTAIQKNVPFISNYDYFLNYCDLKDITVDSLLGDGLHPNDNGYAVMFKSVMRGLGLSIIRDGMAS